MNMQPEIKIMPVPRPMVGAMWPHVAPHLVKGLQAAPNVDVLELGRDIMSGATTLWGVFEGMEIVAAFVTDQRQVEGSSFVSIYALGGSGIQRWVQQLVDEVADKSKGSGARSVRFVGKRGYEKLLPSFSVIGQVDGQQIYERAVA